MKTVKFRNNKWYVNEAGKPEKVFRHEKDMRDYVKPGKTEVKFQQPTPFTFTNYTPEEDEFIEDDIIEDEDDTELAG